MSKLSRASILAIGLMALLTCSGSAGAGRSSLPPWHWQYLKPSSERLTALACVSHTRCYAGDDYGSIYSGVGGRWKITLHGYGPSPTHPIYSVSCLDAHRCVAVDGTEAVALKDGRVAGRHALSGVVAVDCVGAARCYAVGRGTVSQTSDAGAHWTAPNHISPAPLRAIGCTTENRCMVAGASGTVLLTNDGGAHWTAPPVGPASDASFTTVTCPTPSPSDPLPGCKVAGIEASGGRERAVLLDVSDTQSSQAANVTVPPGVEPASIACAGEPGYQDWCFVAGFPIDGATSSLYVTGDDGQSWSPVVLQPRTGKEPPQPSVDAVSCTYEPDFAGVYYFCMAVGDGGTVMQLYGGGDTWLRDLRARPSLADIACPAKLRCYAAGTALMQTANGGKSWHVRAKTGFLMGAHARIACPGAKTCIVAGTTASVGTLEITPNGGASWRRLPAPTPRPADVDCPAWKRCYLLGSAAGGSALYASTDQGSHWTRFHLPAHAAPVALACPDAARCFAVGRDEILRTTDGGRHWDTYHARIDTGIGSDGASIADIACSSRYVCLAVAPDYGREYTGTTILRTVDGGAHWTRVLNTGSSSGAQPDMRRIACRPTGQCLAVGDSGGILQTGDGGSTWRYANSQTHNQLEGAACAADGLCYAVGVQGTILADGG